MTCLRKTWSLFFTAWALFLGTGCATHSRWATRVEWPELSLEEVPGREAYPDADAVVLLDEGHIEILSGSELELSIFERHRIVKILTPAGLRYANVVIAYDPRNSVEGIQARTIGPDGRITVLDKKSVYDVSLYPSYVWYSDQRAKIFTFPAAEVGSTLEYRYRMHIRHLTFWHSWSFQDLVPVKLSRFTLVGPSEWEVRYRTYGAQVEPKVNRAPQGFKSTYVWEMRDVPALASEFAMPPLKERLVRLAIAPAGVKEWKDVSSWYHGLAAPQMKVTEEMRRLAEDLTRGISDPVLRLRRLFEWVRDKVRYVAVEIGIGGYQPHPAPEVFRNRYGDCKDMVTLLCAMATAVGIPVQQAIISTWHNGPPDTSLPSQLQFNHVIAFCPELGVWMDPTEKGCPFGQLPWYDQGLPVLLVGPNGEAEILVTPRQPADSNRREIWWQVDLAADGAARVKGEMRLYGAVASELREELFLATPSEVRYWLETTLAKQCSGAELDSFRVTGLEEVEDPLRIAYHFRTNSFVQRRGTLRLFQPSDVVGFDLPEYFRSTQRTHPVRFRFGMRTTVTLDIRYPPWWQPMLDQKPDSVVSAFGEARWRIEPRDGGLRVELDHCLRAVDVAPDQYPSFRNFLEEVRVRNLRQIVFTEGASASVRVPAPQPGAAEEFPLENRKGILAPEHPFHWVKTPSLAWGMGQFLQISQYGQQGLGWPP
ncbi:MAG: DUF3857 domain-containing protein [candidate division KSB1 bacterium]|nr:DUF3857 domain-containing protein [candidate division KSB1 bacterium]